MASSSRRSYDTDTITLRTIFAKNGANSNIPALRVLTADGAGGCYWAIPSTLGILPAFNQIVTGAASYTADLSFNTFRLLDGEGIGMVNGPSGSNATTLFAKAFNTIDISGDNGIAAFSNNVLNGTVNLAGGGSVQVRSDPVTNTIFIEGPTNAFVSTGIYGFHQFKFIEGASSIQADTYELPGTFITANSPSTVLRFVGVGDLLISTQTTFNTAFLSISTFTSKGYLEISGAAFSAYPSTLSTVSSIYAQTSQLLSVSQYFSSANDWGVSSFLSAINALAMSTGSNFFITTGLINANANIDTQNFQTNKSTIEGLGNIFLSTPSLDLVLASTVSGLGGAATVKYNIVSSLKTSAEFLIAGNQESIVDYATDGDMVFSSFVFSLSSFSSYIQPTSQLFIDERPNWVFSEFSTQTVPFATFDIQKLSFVGLYNEPVTFSESVLEQHIGMSFTAGQCNYWTTPLFYPVDTSNVMSNITSSFVIGHVLTKGYFFSNSPIEYNEPGLAFSSILIRTSPDNSVFLHIYNS